MPRTIHYLHNLALKYRDYHSGHTVPAVKVYGTVNASLCTQILNEKRTSCLKKLGLRGIFQQDNNPKHTAKDFLDKRKQKVELFCYVHLHCELLLFLDGNKFRQREGEKRIK
uniref:Tc1-like transposase DDE domain-containing protein n=1 Tax=Lates calcarifer TaxID=8187 RepID=A0A4W6DJN3_LATCA